MKVKARVNMYTDDCDCYGNRFINLDLSAFFIPENVKIDVRKFKEIEFDIPIVNELEKYSSKELEEELNSRNENHVGCKYCNSRLRKSTLFLVGASFLCPMCGQINYHPYYSYKGEF